jgi:PAS domain S-box-containing protein
VARDENGRPARIVGVSSDITESRARSEAIARLASIVESCDDAVISTDLDFHIVSWNPGAEQMFGFTAKEVIGRNTEDVFPRPINHGAGERKDALRDGATVTSVEREWPTKDGRSVVALSSFFPLTTPDGRTIGYASVARDIGALTRAKEATARLAQIVEASAEAIVSTDLDWRVTSWNHGAERLLGYSATEAIGQDSRVLFGTLDDPGATARRERLAAGDGTSEVEQTTTTRSGEMLTTASSSFPIRGADGAITGYAGVTRDITERKRADDLLRESEARFRAFVEAAPSAIWMYGGSDTLFVNDALLAMTGYTRQELTAPGQFDRLFDPEDNRRMGRRAQARLRGEKVEPSYEVRITRADGQQRWLGVSAASIALDGRPAVLVNAFDITDRKDVEVALRESEARFRAFVEAAPSAIWIYDGSDIPYVNTALLELTGYSREQLGTLRDFQKLFAPEDNHALGTEAQTRLRGGNLVHDYEIRVTRADGEKRWVALSAATITLDGRPAVLVNAFDITDRKDVEVALRESEARFRAVVDSVLTAIWIFDGDRLVFVNQAVCDITGCAREQLLQGGFRPLFDEEDAAALLAQSRARLRGEPAPTRYELRIRRPDGELRWLDVASSVVRLSGRPVALASALDITDRKRAEQLLHQSEQRFRSLVDNSPDYITRIDRDLKHVFVNATAEREARLDPGKILGKRADELGYPAEIGALWVTRHQQVLDCGEPIEFEYELGEGSQAVWRRCRLIPEFGEGGAVEHVLSVVTDFTAEKRAEEERRRLDLQVQNAQKLESLGVLAGGIAHDFNNLLVAVLGNAGLALMELPPESPARETVKAIEIAAQRAADLTRQMLAYSGKGRFVIEMLNLSRVVEEMSHLLEVSISKRARLEYHFAPGLPQVEADATQIRQVIMNLITNAADAVSERGGAISLSTGVIHADAGYLAGAYIDSDLTEGDYVFVEVADTGEGMDEETRQRIFDPFFTTKFTGRGLGLAAVLGIVRGHKGAIRVESQLGRGTTVTVLLPAALTPASFARGVPEPVSKPSSPGSATVLVADDDETVRNVTRRILERSGYSVLLAVDGREAVALYAANGHQIDIVLLDMTMPRMNGEETFQALREIDPHVRVLLTSGYTEQDATERFAGKGLVGFIQKPYRPAELTERIEAALAAE